MKKYFFILTMLLTLLFSISVKAAVEQPISFLQDDSEWGSKSYSITNSSYQTIATSGCGPTSMAMVLNYYIDDSINPADTAVYAVKNGYRTYSEGTTWQYFGDMAKKFDLEFLQTASSVEALEWMETKEDALIVCSMGPGLWTSRGHFIVIWDVENNIAYINDPASEKDNRIKNSYRTVSNQCRQYFCFNKKVEVIEEDTIFPLLFKDVENYIKNKLIKCEIV